MLKNVADLTSQDTPGSLNTIQDIFKLKREDSPNCMNVKFFFDGKKGKRLGTSTMNSVALSQTNSAGTLGVTTCGMGTFDFGAGAGGVRWYIAQGGTALWASSDLGFSFVRIASDRSATYQNFERSVNGLVCCSDAYDRPLFWPGSAGTFATMLNISAPLAKFAINFNGFLLFLNNSSNKREVQYANENLQLTAGYKADGNYFPLPSSFDDEITGTFTISNRLFVSTRYKLFLLTFVGGNPDWNFKEIQSWGFVPRTVDKITFGEVGEIAIGLDWSRRIRIFDGGEDKIISEKVENDNGSCDFATNKISFAGSGLSVSFGKTDDNEQVYKLGVTIGQNSSQVTHSLCLNGRTQSMYPYDYINNKLMSMCMAESGNRRYLMAMDQSGWLHMMDSGNKDRNTYAVNDVLDSPVLFEKSPSQTAKSQKIDLYFSVNSAGSVIYQDAVDFGIDFTTRKVINITSGGKIQHFDSVDIPSTQNTYQYRITSSSGTNTPWELNRVDYFLTGLGIGSDIKRT